MEPLAGDARLAKKLFRQFRMVRNIRRRRHVALVNALVAENLLRPVVEVNRVVVQKHLHARRADALDAGRFLIEPALHHARSFEK